MSTLNFPTVAEIAGPAFWVEPFSSRTVRVGVVDNREALEVGAKLGRLAVKLTGEGFSCQMVNRGAFSFLKVEREVYRSR